MKYKIETTIQTTQFVVIFLFLMLTCCNELFDIPYLLLGDAPTTVNQRMGEISIEIGVFAIIVIIEWIITKMLLKRIKILEGFLPICANCKNIREENHWKQMESYITEHSLAKFSHTICPDCAKKLYPDLNLTDNKS